MTFRLYFANGWRRAPVVEDFDVDDSGEGGDVEVEVVIRSLSGIHTNFGNGKPSMSKDVREAGVHPSDVRKLSK
jgi:hypothetical protein